MEFYQQLKPIKGETVAALGYFDGVHLGHREVILTAIAQAKKIGALSAVLTFDMHSFRADGKGKGDLSTYDCRKQLMEELGTDILMQLDFSHICGLEAETFVYEILGAKGLNCSAVCCGADFRFGKNRSGDIDTLRELCYEIGIDVIVVGEVEYDDRTISTTLIKEFIKNGQIDRAKEMLGHGYGFVLPVYSDKKLARTLGFPTINQKFPPYVVAPRLGVYCSKTDIDGAEYSSISNIGKRPTVHSEDEITIETHIIGFNGDLYGKTVGVELVAFLRDEQKFGSKEELKAAALQDIETAKQILKNNL